METLIPPTNFTLTRKFTERIYTTLINAFVVKTGTYPDANNLAMLANRAMEAADIFDEKYEPNSNQQING